MHPSFEDLTRALTEKHIGLSYQRMKVIEYLAQHPVHPTADQIYTELHKDIPTLSKTTVYNTLKVLTEAGLVKMLTIEDNEVRYDTELQLHGHFKCLKCGTIYNFCVNMEALSSDDLKNFQIKDKNVYFDGVCPKCLAAKEPKT